MDSNSSGFVCLGWVGYLVVYLSAPACCLLHLATWHLAPALHGELEMVTPNQG